MSGIDPSTEVMPRTGAGTAAATEAGETTTFEWTAVQQAFRTAGHEFCLTKVNADGLPHVAPVFAAWADAAFFVATKATARKTRDLQGDGRCVVATNIGDAHVVVAFTEVYDCPTTIIGDEIEAPYAAPTSGGSPFLIWELRPVKAFGFPTDGESAAPTRWRFEV